MKNIKELLELDSADLCIKPQILMPGIVEEVKYLNQVMRIATEKGDYPAFERATQSKKNMFEVGLI